MSLQAGGDKYLEAVALSRSLPVNPSPKAIACTNPLESVFSSSRMFSNAQNTTITGNPTFISHINDRTLALTKEELIELEGVIGLVFSLEKH